MFNPRPSSPPSSCSPSGASVNPDGERLRTETPELDYWLGKRDTRSIPEDADARLEQSDDSELGKRDGRCANEPRAPQEGERTRDAG